MRIIYLYFRVVFGLWRRFVADWAKEATVLICAAVLLWTFVTIFDDFLNTEIKTLSNAMRDRFAEVLATGLFAVASLASGLASRGWRDSLSSTFPERIGESQTNSRLYNGLAIASIIGAGNGLALVIADRYLVTGWWQWSLLAALFSALIAALPIAALGTTLRPKDRRFFRNRRTAIFAWRFWPLITRNRSSQIALACAVGGVAFGAYGYRLQLPSNVVAAILMFAGYGVAAAITFQCADDLKHSWFEKLLGLSHEEFASAYNQVSYVVGVLFAILSGALLGAIGMHWDIETIGRASLLSAIPALFTPWIVLQIDGRRPFIPIITMVLCTLFIGTAILVSWFGVLLVPVFKYFAEAQQKDRYYRAA
jgi:hypothetical protein